MTLADATHIVYPTRPARTVDVMLMMRKALGWHVSWKGKLTLNQFTSIRVALETHVWCLPPGRLYVNDVCMCEFGCALTGESGTRKETTL